MSAASPGGRAKPSAGADGRALRRQGEKTRATLLDAGMKVLAERGYHAARVDDVVRVADVSHGTFYLYFANKEDLFRALAVQCAGDMTELAGSLGPVGPGADGLAELERWLGEFVGCYRRYGVVIRAWMEDQAISRDLSRLGVRTFTAIATGLVARISEQRPLGAHEAQLQAAALLALIERFTYFHTSRQLDVGDDQVVATLAVLIHRGFFGGDPTTGPRRPKAATRS